MRSSWLTRIGHPIHLIGLSVDKTIADTSLGLNVARFIGIILKLLADLANEVAQIMCVAHNPCGARTERHATIGESAAIHLDIGKALRVRFRCCIVQ
jgi:phosphohistidine phosphatase SixA